MIYKGIFKDSPFWVQFILLLSVAIFGAIFSNLIFFGFWFVKSGFSLSSIPDLMDGLLSNAEAIRQLQFFQSLGTFFFPSIFLAWLFSDDVKTYLDTEKAVSWSVISLTILSMLLVLPFLSLTMYWNESIVLPDSLRGLEDWMKAQELQMKEIVELMLDTDDIGSLLLNILIIGVLAGVGEELFFRGVLQKVFSKLFKNHHVIIWLVAIIFSAIHVQFYGFIPRMLMGAYFGYLLYYSGSIWLPVLAHFTNNTIGVLLYYFLSAEEFEFFEQVGAGSTYYFGVLSFVLWLTAFYFIRKKCLPSAS